MKPPSHDASARHRSSELSSLPGQGGGRKNRPRRPDLAEIEGDIAALVKLSTQELRGAWHKLHRTGPPLGLSRDLMIRTLANNLQERAHDGPRRALRPTLADPRRRV